MITIIIIIQFISVLFVLYHLRAGITATMSIRDSKERNKNKQIQTINQITYGRVNK